MTAAVKNAHVWDRSDDEWYREPADCTSALLQVERFPGGVWDPACGAGSVLDACEANGVLSVGTDIVDRGANRLLWQGCADFLRTPPRMFRAHNIITNPPFARGVLIEAFIRHALNNGALNKLAVFADIKFLAGSGRAQGLYSELPPSRVWILTPRPSCPPGAFLEAGNKAQGGTADWAWLVWDRSGPHTGTQLRWLTREVAK